MKYDLKARTFKFALQIVHPCQLLDERPGVPRSLSRQLLGQGLHPRAPRSGARI